MLVEGMKTNPNLKLIGLCFGHQAIAKAYGAKIEKHPLINGMNQVFLCQ